MAGQARAQEPCTVPAGTLGASRDLYCIELMSTGLADSARGTAQLDWPGGPFTVAVTGDGTHRWRITTRLAGLPPVEGPLGGYVAWAMPPSLSPVTRLGVVHRSGLTRSGELAFDRFTVLISAEPDTTATERHGPVVLLGESAGNRLRPPDLYQFFIGSIGTANPHAGHGGMGDSLGWSGVPMYPGVDMLPAEMLLRPTERAWLPEAGRAPAARPRQVLDLRDGDTLDLTAGVVTRTIAGRRYTMFGFNGQYPGPLLRVRQASRLTVRFHNRLPQPSSVHWHGLRLENRFDGVPDLTQPAVPPGGDFSYTLTFPDAGIYWYHPHVREDIQQDLGLYGNIFVRDSLRGPPGWREEFLILDDFLVGEDGAVPYGATQPTHAAMGRFGNVLLINGETNWRTSIREHRPIRFYLTNASNTRTFNLSFGPGARMQVVGSDLGTYERNHPVQSIVIGPAERYVVDVEFLDPGRVALVNRVRAIDHLYGRFFSRVDTLGIVTVNAASGVTSVRVVTRDVFSVPGPYDAWVARAARAPLRTLELRAQFTGLPFVTEQLMRIDSIYFNPVEWDGTMPGMNWSVTGAQARWVIRDPETGAENMDIHWRFRVGDLVRLRLVGARDVLHGMQHPMHLHGQRFLVLAVNGIANENPVWKDTALLPAGSSLDLLVEFSNPGRWMLHCHIAEHLQAGMMTVLDVEAR